MSKPTWENWYLRAKAAKAAVPKLTDVEIAEAISETLEAMDRPTVQRGIVNHWFNGRRQPDLLEYMLLCKVLQADPAEILFGCRLSQDSNVQTLKPLARNAEIATAIKLLEDTDDTGRKLALGGMKAAMLGHSPAPRKRGAAK